MFTVWCAIWELSCQTDPRILLGLWSHPWPIRVKDKTPFLGRNSVTGIGPVKWQQQMV